MARPEDTCLGDVRKAVLAKHQMMTPAPSTSASKSVTSAPVTRWATAPRVWLVRPNRARSMAVASASVARADAECAVVESVKAASDLYAPASGEVTAGNAAVAATPKLVNQDPYGAWLFKLNPAADFDLGTLMDASAYATIAAGS